MHVSVVIVGFRNAGDIVRCTQALGASDYADFDVVVVENGGPAAFEALRAALPDRLAGGQPLMLVEAPGNLGFAGGINLGLARTAEADAWWGLNPDAVPAPDALGALVARLARGDCDAVGGVLHYADGTVQSLGGHWQGWLARAVSIGAGSRVGDPVDAAVVEQRMDYLLGASMLVSRRFLEVVGPMCDDYFLYAEEIEWFLRAKQKGMRLGFAPTAKVLHYQGTTTGWANGLRGRSRLPVYLDERNRVLVMRDRFPSRFPVVALASLAFMLARFARSRAWRQIGYAFQGWKAGVAGERGVPRWHSA
ncbi:glycosyltransferase family 2 protein [Novosphingobium sp. MD-1]|uniref:glycosyltransferase family 2 protein n=1 Tax=Novosphingobium sp. MD-1 TaxID=1630648 RepID=UPI00061CA660|nr:glycosyltransferase family 2 protein [Novosphingobium sp. MD-1]GAO55343.1 glycosyl transferase family 2 [Novosphingobium sp. MD-1]